MHKFKALFKLLDDDLRDAEMHIKYAEEIYEDGDKAIGAMFVKEAHSRLEHFDYFGVNYHQMHVQRLFCSLCNGIGDRKAIRNISLGIIA